ncbi:unnamed protein product [Rhizopus stolonifer]
MLMLSQLQNQQEELDSVISTLLNNNKALLLLPVSIPFHPSAIVDEEFITDHIIITTDENENQFVSLSGIQGIFENDQLIIANYLEKFDINSLSTRSLFSLDSSSMVRNPKYTILASHLQLPLKDEKRMNVVMLQKPISRKEITDWINRDTLKEDTLSHKIEEFVKDFKKNVPRTIDLMSEMFLDFMHELYQDFSDDKDKLDKIESYICQQLYTHFFPDPRGDESMQGEALESRIAAFNLLDLDLSHLGVSISQEGIDLIVKLAGAELQELNAVKGPKEKLDRLVKIHQIITNTVQEDTNDKEEKITMLNTDVLLPLLIYTIVKTNPTNLLSNIKFIQRFRRQDQLNGQSSYCLTNTMAAVSFLESANLVGLGLSADKVISHVEDLANTKKNAKTSPGGLKLVNDVVDSSYKVIFDSIGKLWQRNTVEKAQNGPITKFLEMKSVEELKIGEVTELLADYKRLAAIIKQAGLE